MSSTRMASRTTTNSKTTSLNTQHINGSTNSYDLHDATANLNYPTGNTTEFDSSIQRSALIRDVSQYDGIYRNARFIHAISSGLVGQQVVIQTSDHERFHGVLETMSPNADIVLTVSHRLDNNNNNDIIASSNLPIDLIDTVDSSSQKFELHKRIIKASNIVEMIAVDVDLSNSAKCLLDENPKVSQLEDDRFSRMEHFYGSDDIDPETLEDLDLGGDGKAGFAPEDMFHTNREKFNTTTDFDESKYTNVPVRQLSAVEFADIEKKVQEIERGVRTEDIDEDDAGVKRPLDSHNLDDSNSNLKANRANRNDFRYDTEYNPSKRENWREQRPTGNNNRRGGGNNPRQNQYNSTYNRQQHNTRISRNNRYPDNRSPYEGRDSSSQNEETTRNQQLNTGNFPQGQSSGPTSPSTTVAGRTIYSNTHRATANRNSPAPYTGSSSSRNNSVSNTSSPPNQLTKKPSLNEKPSISDESDPSKQQRSSNNQSNTTALHHPTQLTSKQQSSSTTTTVPPPLLLPNQDENFSSHDTMNSNNTGTTTPNSTKSNGALNPDADEFVPVFSRESSSRPESRGGSTTSSASLNTFTQHPHPQTLHILQQQQVPPQPTPPMIPATHPQNAAALYQQYYQPTFANMPQFFSATPQQMTVGVMGAPIIPSQPLAGTGPNTSSSNNGGSSGMTTPNSSVSGGPTYKVNNNTNNQAHSGDNGNTGTNNVPPKKAVVSVQRSEQSNAPPQQQQQMPGTAQMIFPAPPIRYYPPEYLAQQGAPSSMQLPTMPFYYQVNPSGLIQTATGVGQPQNMMISSANSSAGPMTPGLTPFHYGGMYADPRMYSIYSSAAINAAGVNPNWQLARSPPQQQQTDQQRGYGNGQHLASQQTSTTGASNPGTRPASTSGQTSSGNNGGPSITPHYALNGAIPTAYAYGTPTGWMTSTQQVPSSQTNIPPQPNAAYNVIFDPSQPVSPQQPTYAHPNPYETQGFIPSQSQQQQPPPPQQGLDTVQQGNYNR